jgi:hypothetical protein
MLGGLTLPRYLAQGEQQDRPGFWGNFTPEEQEAIQGSEMARSIPGYLGQGLGCAEICLAASVDYLGETRDWLDAAAVFSGGFGQQDLCGFLTGGMMAIGVAAGTLHEDRAALKEFARPRAQQYWEWWTSRGPLHCSELTRMYEGREEFIRMGQRSAAKLEQLFEPAH